MSVVAMQQTLVRRSLRGIWGHLPLLAVSSAVACLSAAAAVLPAPGSNPITVLLAVVLLAPAVVALGAVANDIVRTGDASWQTWWTTYRTGWRTGVVALAPIAFSAALFAAAVQAWHSSGSALLLPSVGVGGAVTLALVPLTAATVLLSTARPHSSWRVRWHDALLLVARWPMRFVAAPVLLGFGVWIGTQVSVSLLLLVPAPVAMVGAAGLWTSAVESGLLTPSIDEAERNHR